jgi:hypothetical protein
MITAKEITEGYLKQFRDGGKGYYQGMCITFLQKAGFTWDSICDFFGHPDVQTWSVEFIMGQTMMMVGGVRDVRIHDVTISTLRHSVDFSFREPEHDLVTIDQPNMYTVTDNTVVVT